MGGDLFANTGEAIFLRIDGVYYRRVVGRGWPRITEADLPTGIVFNKLHEKQRAAMVPALIEAKLMEG